MENESKKWNDVVNEILRIRERNNGLLLVSTPEWKNKIIIKANDLINPDFKSNSEFLKINSSAPSVYLFKVRTKEKGVTISKEELKKIAKENQIKLAKVSKDIVLNDNDTLYCGSVEKNLHYRLQQHLGYGSNQTYSLQLKYWLSKYPIELELIYTQFSPGFKHAIRLIETAATLTYAPLVGKSESLY